MLLKEAGWALGQPRDREFEVAGMPNTQEKGFVDYVLWGDDGIPALLNESPFTDLSPTGPEGIVSPVQLDQLIAALSQVREGAIV